MRERRTMKRASRRQPGASAHRLMAEEIAKEREERRKWLLDRARKTVFSVRVPEGDVYPRIFVQETVFHGSRQAFLKPAVDDWRDIVGAQVVANEVLCYLESLGLLTEARRAAKTYLFALEVVRYLQPGFRLTALHVLMWVWRDLSGPEVVEAANG